MNISSYDANAFCQNNSVQVFKIPVFYALHTPNVKYD